MFTKLLHTTPWNDWKCTLIAPHWNRNWTAPDTARILNFCRWLKTFVQKHGIGVLDRVFSWFHRIGYINACKYWFWSSTNPHIFKESSLYTEKIGVWRAMSRKRIVRPIFFTSTITGVAYREIIIDFISLLETDEHFVWFQQDSSPTHTANDTLSFFREFFGDRLITKRLVAFKQSKPATARFLLVGLFEKSRVPWTGSLDYSTENTH